MARPFAFFPLDFIYAAISIERYGKLFSIAVELTIQDWGVTYDELEPHYDRFEYLCGICGKAGNIKGSDSARRQSVRGSALARIS